ncbi:uncharacterized protein DUF499 [Streptomyces sp. 3212.3]|uniref:DUF499 domain-containing protein n=1 Tax=Streptomyces sp. 3212.3 TaxID=1938846 RepID=UPI000E25CBC6|nr:DUF499 domain-containing protein [Streptomyces sp. 3212.3]REE63396.1 uncharacterized protein DUF499 [Streptomyces sp. 3212.3]
MKSLFELVEPRDDVLAGELTESRFAASLEEVTSGTAADAYGDAEHFFAATFPSAGLKSLLNEALGRISGGKPDGASVIRLETNLGGGKTHNLIALFHAARGHLDPKRAAEFMEPSLLPSAPVEQVGAFVGTSSGAQSFPQIDNIKPRTLWGYLALQVGGAEGYELVRADDEALTAPGSDAIKRLLGDRPSLLLIDEIARYYRVAKGVSVGESTLAKQTTAFLMALMEAVDGLPHAAMVITTTGVTDAFGEETSDILAAVDEARSLMARKELTLRPSKEADLPQILARRLFKQRDWGSTVAATAEAYAEAADSAYRSGLDLPESMTGTGWAADITRTYPFHPSLIRILDKRLSTIPNFQRTRGALRLLARVVRRLWAQHPDHTYLIHPHHIDLSDRAIAEELSSRLERAEYEPVIRADIASQNGAERSHAERVDERMGASYARRLATATYLYSLTRDVPGVQPPELFGAALVPGDDPNLLQKALDGLESDCWYLHADVRGYRFSTEASLVKLIQEAESEISVTRARQRATKILTDQFRDGTLKIRRHWDDAKVPDNAADAWLVVLHWDDFGDARGVDPHGPIPTKIQELWERTPSGGNREYRNRLVLLAPSQGTHEAMVRAVKTHLALDELSVSAGTLNALTPTKRGELKDKAKEWSMLARVAVCNHVNVLYVPRAQGLEAVQLDQVTSSSVFPNQTDAILNRLAAMEKTLRAGDRALDPAYVKNKLGDLMSRPQPTEELVKAFARRSDLKMVFDTAQLHSLISAGVRNGVWEYQDPERGDDGWATRDRPGFSPRLSADVLLHPPGSAPAPVEQVCPLCETLHPGRGCPDDSFGGAQGDGDQLRFPQSKSVVFTGTGAAGSAFTQARSAAAEVQRERLHELKIEINHTGTGGGPELLRLHSIVPATTLGTDLTYKIEAVVALGSDPMHTAKIDYFGTPRDYAPLREALKQLLGPRESVIKASVTAIFEDSLPLSGDAVERFGQAARDTGPTKCTISMRTESDG